MDKEELLSKILNEPSKLSDEQRNAVLSDSKYIRIIAGAGAGKTETLTRRIVYLLMYQGVEPKDIVAFTFTEKAAQNMKTRIYERVKNLNGEEACARIGEMYVGTIHGYCLRILQDYFDYGEYNILDENQEMAVVLREGWSLGKKSIGKNESSYSKYCQDLLKSINVVYDELIDRKKITEKSPDFLEYKERYEEILRKHRLFTFGQIIFEAVQSLESNPEFLAFIQHLIVDEYQDINRAQERLIQIIGEKSNVFVVGDPRQSIYQWRGSDDTCFEDFVKHFNPSQTFQIKENRRSTNEIITVANAFADTFQGSQYEHIKPLRTEKGASINVLFETPEDEAKWIIARIRRIVEEEKRCDYNDCAILLRSVKSSAEPFIQEFKQQDVRYVVGGKVGLFRREEASAVGMLFCWLSNNGFYVANPYGWSEQIKGDELLKESIRLWNNATKHKNSTTEKDKIKEWKQNVYNGKYENFTGIYHDLLVILGFKRLNASDKNQAAVMSSLGRFSNLLSDYESSIRLDGRQPDWTKVFDGLCWFINTYATGAYEEQPSEDLRGIDAVQIMTVHQAKGLEWSAVFIPALTKKRFPANKVGMQQNWYISTDLFPVERYESRDKQGNKLYDSERKLFYVALTRAKDLLCLSRFRRIKIKQSPTIFYESIEKLLTDMNPASFLPDIKISPSLDEEEIQTFSPGEIINYLKCPFFYRLRELWNYQPGLVEPLGYGKSLHYCLHFATKLMQEGKSLKEAISEAIDVKFHVPYAGGVVREDMKNEAKKVLLKFAEEHRDELGKIQDMEVRLEFPVHKATIAGRIDVILKDGNLLEVRDYKTSDEVTTFEEGSIQVQLYALGLDLIGKQINQGSLAYLENSKVARVDVSKSSLESAKDLTEKTIGKIKMSYYDAVPCEFCGKCDYNQICRYRKI